MEIYMTIHKHNIMVQLNMFIYFVINTVNLSNYLQTIINMVVKNVDMKIILEIKN